MLTNEIRTGSAREFAAQLTAAGHKPPKAVTKATAALDRLQSTRTALPSFKAAEAAAAELLTARAEAGTLEAADVTSVTSELAGHLTTAAAFESTIRALKAAEDTLGYRYAGAIGGWMLDLIPGALRAQYLEAAAVIDQHAPGLPLSLDDTTALRNVALREQWLAVSDAADMMGRCLSLVTQARNVALIPRPMRDPLDAFMAASNPYALDDPRLLNGDGFGTIRTTLPDHPIHRLLEMSRRGARWHFPTHTEQDAAASAFLDAPPAMRAQMAGEAA